MTFDWERRNGKIDAEEIVLFKTGWDRCYVPGQEGEKYVSGALVTEKYPNRADRLRRADRSSSH